MVGPEGTRSRPVRGYIIFAFAIALALLAAYLMREILLLLYVSALFAVVLSPVIRGIQHLHIKRCCLAWAPPRPCFSSLPCPRSCAICNH